MRSLRSGEYRIDPKSGIHFWVRCSSDPASPAPLRDDPGSSLPSLDQGPRIAILFMFCSNVMKTYCHDLALLPSPARFRKSGLSDPRKAFARRRLPSCATGSIRHHPPVQAHRPKARNLRLHGLALCQGRRLEAPGRRGPAVPHRPAQPGTQAPARTRTPAGRGRPERPARADHRKTLAPRRAPRGGARGPAHRPRRPLPRAAGPPHPDARRDRQAPVPALPARRRLPRPQETQGPQYPRTARRTRSASGAHRARGMGF